MLVELGPVAAADVETWSRFARRVVTEVRTNPADLDGIATDDLLRQWSGLIERWADCAREREQFRWSESVDCEIAEYLLHGLERCLQSPSVRSRITPSEYETHRPFTMHVISAFVFGLEGEGHTYEEYASQLRGSLGDSLT